MKTFKQLQEIIGKDIKSDYKTLDPKAFFQEHGKRKSEVSSFVREAKDEEEYGYEGDMAINQLNTIIRHSKYLIDMLKPDTDLPEWVQSKITLAADYIQTSCDYLTSEMDEAVEVGDDPVNAGTPDNLVKKNGKTTVAKSLPVTEDTMDEMAGANMDVRQVHKHLKKSGWSLTRTSGGHDVYTHPKSTEHIAVPRHRSLKAPLVLGIMKTAKRVTEGRDPTTQSHADAFKRETDKMKPTTKKYVGRKGGKEVYAKKDAQANVKFYHRDGIKGPLKSVAEEVEQLEEGRPSQQHPLEGHEYHKKSNAELEYIAKDAHEAAEAMKSHGTESGRRAENKYRDQASDSATVRYFRKKSGMPDWYKKKYGHVKEEVELDEMAKPVSRKAQIVKSAAKKDKFIDDPIISNTDVKADGDQR
jgi:predicted RNA binding protein YcfA (HicA-like mRNA interferase family)